MTRIAYTPGMTLDEPLVNAEVYGANPQRVSNQAGSSPTDIQLLNVDLGVEARHVVIHDVHNVGWWVFPKGSGRQGVLRGVAVYNPGYKGVDRNHGHALYTQNYDDSSKLIDSCVFVAGFYLALQMYGSGNQWKDDPLGWLSADNVLSNFTTRDSVFVGRSIVGAEGRWGAHNIVFERSMFMAGSLAMGYRGQNGVGRVTDCFLTRTFQTGIFERREPQTYRDSRGKVVSWQSLTVTGNTFVLPAGEKIECRLPGAPGDWTWDDNTYWSENPRPFTVVEDTGTAYVTRSNLSFDEWRSLTGFDANSTFRIGTPPSVHRTYGGVYGIAWSATPTPTPTQPGPGRVLYPPPPILNWDGPLPYTVDPRLTIWRADDERDLRIWSMELDAAEKEAQHAAELAAKETELTEALDALASATAFEQATMDLWRALDVLMARSEVSDETDFSAEYEAFVAACAVCEPLIKLRWYSNGAMPGGMTMLQAEIQALKDAIAALETAAAAQEAAHQQTVTTLTAERDAAVAERDAALLESTTFRGVLGQANSAVTSLASLLASYAPVAA